MSATTTQQSSALELSVQAFIRTHRRHTVATRYIQGAIDLINLKLAKDEFTQLVLPLNLRHNLTLLVLGNLNNMTKHRNLDSINRTKTLLTNYKNS